MQQLVDNKLLSGPNTIIESIAKWAHVSSTNRCTFHNEFCCCFSLKQFLFIANENEIERQCCKYCAVHYDILVIVDSIATVSVMNLW